jgi:hypothetical protein
MKSNPEETLAAAAAAAWGQYQSVVNELERTAERIQALGAARDLDGLDQYPAKIKQLKASLYALRCTALRARIEHNKTVEANREVTRVIHSAERETHGARLLAAKALFDAADERAAQTDREMFAARTIVQECELEVRQLVDARVDHIERLAGSLAADAMSESTR